MKLTVERDALVAALTRVGGVVARRSTIPILANVMLTTTRDGLRLTGSDLDIEMTEGVAAQVDAKGAVTVPASTLSDFVNSLASGAEISMSLADGDPRLKVAAGRARAMLPVLAASEFPAIAKQDMPWGGLVDSAVLSSLINQTRHAISNDPTRYMLSGLHICTPTVNGAPVLRMVATDGHRLSCADWDLPEGFTPIDGEASVIIPAKTVQVISKLLEVASSIEIRVSEQRVQVSVGDAVMASKVVDARFPDYERVIPKDQRNGVTLDAAALLPAVKRVSAFSEDKAKAVKLTLEGGQGELTARGDSSGEAVEQFEAAQDGERIETGFNARYLLDVLGLCGPKTRFGFNAGNEPALVTDPALAGVRHVLMPLRV